MENGAKNRFLSMDLTKERAGAEASAVSREEKRISRDSNDRDPGFFSNRRMEAAKARLRLSRLPREERWEMREAQRCGEGKCDKEDRILKDRHASSVSLERREDSSADSREKASTGVRVLREVGCEGGDRLGSLRRAKMEGWRKEYRVGISESDVEVAPP